MCGENTAKAGSAPAAQAASASFPPQQAAPQRKERCTVAGTVLLCTGAVISILCLLLVGNLLAGLLLASPFFICGIICFAVKRHAGLFCGWAVYLCLDLYLRFATGLSWTTIFMTPIWTAQMNYMRLFIAWVQFLVMLVMIICTVCSYRTLKLPAAKKEVSWLVAGWLAAFVLLPLLMRYGIMPLWTKDLHNYSQFSPYYFIGILYDYVRLALVTVLLVRTLAVWRRKREEKKTGRNAAVK